MLKRGEKYNVELSSEQIILLRLLVGSVAGYEGIVFGPFKDQISGDQFHEYLASVAGTLPCIHITKSQMERIEEGTKRILDLAEPKPAPSPVNTTQVLIDQIVALQDQVEKLQKQISDAKSEMKHPPAAPDVGGLVEALEAFMDIVHGSDGVAGYHLNGAVAEWDEFQAVHDAAAALAAHRKKGSE